MKTATNLTNQFLIAMPTLEDSNFEHAVTYICEHNENGAMGIVINRPAEIPLGEIFSQLEIPEPSYAAAHSPVYLGGPVQQERGFVLHNPMGIWESSFTVSDEVAITTSRDILAALAEERGPSHTLVALGYAGWGAGQLEREIAENAWMSAPASSQIIFHLPVDQRWKAAAAAAGIDISRISSDFGHA